MKTTNPTRPYKLHSIEVAPDIKLAVYDYHNLIYGDRNATESLCGGGDGKMKTCLVL